MFCEGEESLGLELFRNGSVHEFYRLKALITLEQVNTSVVDKKRRLLISKRLTGAGVVNFHCMQMSLEMSMRFIFGSAMIEMTCRVNHFFDIWQ